MIDDGRSARVASAAKQSLGQLARVLDVHDRSPLRNSQAAHRDANLSRCCRHATPPACQTAHGLEGNNITITWVIALGSERAADTS